MRSVLAALAALLRPHPEAYKGIESPHFEKRSRAYYTPGTIGTPSRPDAWIALLTIG